MQDSKDKTTVDAFPVKKRGRPSTGLGKSSAQRMAEKRERDRAIANSSRLQADFEELTNGALIEALADSVRNGYVASARKISAVLIKRAQANE